MIARSRKKRKRTSEDNDEVILFALPQLVYKPNEIRIGRKLKSGADLDNQVSLER